VDWQAIYTGSRDVLGEFGIQIDVRTPMSELNISQKQLIEIAKAVRKQAKIIVMDEPTANLDFGNQVRVLEHIQALAEAGMGVLLSTHDPDQAFLCASRVALLHEGRLARLGGPGETITVESLKQIYGVDVAVVSVPVDSGEQRRVCLPLVKGARGPH